MYTMAVPLPVNAVMQLCTLWLLLFSSLAECLTPAEWRSQSIYQVLTDRFARTDGSLTAPCDTSEYCGGSWQGIISRLDYIQNMGFTAIWISPVVDNVISLGTSGNSYHGYWAQNIYEVNTNFGSASDLVALSDALHSRGMYLMVDVVTNHMGYNGCGECVDYSVFNPFNEQDYYHPFCLIDNSNQTSVQQCWEGGNVVSLPDLRTENATVLAMWETWIKQLVANYTIDGIRLDSAIEVDQAFLSPFNDAAGVYTIGEVLNGNEWQFCAYQEYLDGMLNYPAYFWIMQAFKSTTGSIANLAYGIKTTIGQCTDTTVLGSFLENHDVARFPSYTSDMSLIKNAIGFTMLADGIPIIYQGQEQHFTGAVVPQNREPLWPSQYSKQTILYNYIALLNKIRTHAIKQDNGYLTYNANPVYTDTNTIVMRKGNAGSQVIAVFTNKGASGSGSFSLTSANSGFTATQQVTDILACSNYTTDSSGNLQVQITGGLPQVFYPTNQLSGSGLCGTSNTSSTASTTSPTSACITPTTNPVIFQEEANITSGQTIKIVGSLPRLGSWNTSNAVALTEDTSDPCDPYWYVDLDLKAGATVQYKYIKVNAAGSVTWESDPNHTFTVPSGCQTTAATVANSWQK